MHTGLLSHALRLLMEAGSPQCLPATSQAGWEPGKGPTQARMQLEDYTFKKTHTGLHICYRGLYTKVFFFSH